MDVIKIRLVQEIDVKVKLLELRCVPSDVREQRQGAGDALLCDGQNV